VACSKGNKTYSGRGLTASLMADSFDFVIGRIDIFVQLVTKKKTIFEKIS
jgi:hypothetical protein